MFLFGGTLESCIRKAVESFKGHLVGHTSRSMEDNGAESSINILTVGLDLEVSE